MLAQIETIASLLQSEPERETSYKSDIKEIITVMEKHWKTGDLPTSKRRMAEIVNNYLRLAGKNSRDLDQVIERAKETNNIVFQYLTIPPVQKIFIILFENYEGDMRGRIDSGRHPRILITSEMLNLYPRLRSLTNYVKYSNDES